ncbi:MAG: hypothetical protein ACKVQR_11000 [Aquabacterium sp.]
MKRLVLVGSGPLHRALVRHWARLPPRMADVAWVVPASSALVEEALMPVLAGELAAVQALVSLQDLADAANVRLVIGRPAGLDPVARLLSLSDGRQAAFDGLSVDAAGEPQGDKLPGSADWGISLSPTAAHLDLVDRVAKLAAQRPLDVVVAGAGERALEAALALQVRLAATGTRVAWACGAAGVLSDQPAGVQLLATAALRRHRVAVLPDTVTALAAGSAQLASGARAACDAAVLAQAPRAPAWLRQEATAAAEDAAPGPDVQGRWPPSGPVLCWQALGRSAAPLLAEQLARMMGGGALLPMPPAQVASMLLYSGIGRGLWAGHGLVAEGRLPGLLLRWRLRRRLAEERAIPVVGRR